ncbi:MAG: TRAP transporter substrate-binding protein DctP [Rhodospirillaceae bacterium]|nr:TRAP transporter substrate-binding protein DctP [Rhodospirillaceae bacterium]
MRLFTPVLTMGVLAAGVLAAMPAGAADFTMRISHQLPPPHHLSPIIAKWAAEIKENSKGRIDTQVFGASQAYKPQQNYAAVAKGQIECAFAVNFQWGRTIPEMNITTMPYAITHISVMKKWRGSDAAKFLEAKLEAKGVKNVVWLMITNMSAFTSSTRPLIKPEDFKGIKIRGLNPIADSGLVAMGASPSPIPGDQVYQALQTKVIDAGLTDVSAAYSRKYYEVQKYVTVSPLFSVFLHGYVNPEWWNKLPPDLQKVVTDASIHAEAASIDASEKAAAAAPKQLAAKGVDVHIHTPAEIEVMKKAMQPAFAAAWEKATGADGKKLLELVNKLQ